MEVHVSRGKKMQGVSTSLYLRLGDQGGSDFSVHENHLGTMSHCRFEFLGLVCSERFCLSNKFPGDAHLLLGHREG